MNFLRVACTVVQTFNDEVKAWMAWHLELGFEHFYIYQREPISAADLPACVTLCPWPEALDAATAYQHAARLFDGRADWLLCMSARSALCHAPERSLGAVLDALAEDIGALDFMLSQPSEYGTADKIIDAACLLRPSAMLAEGAPLQLSERWSRQQIQTEALPLQGSIEREYPALWLARMPLEQLGNREHVGLGEFDAPVKVHGQTLSDADGATGDWPSILPQHLLSQCLQASAISSSIPDTSPTLDLGALTACLQQALPQSGPATALALGDTPLSLLLAMVDAGFTLDVIEARATRMQALQQALAGRAGIRFAQMSIRNITLDLHYHLIVVADDAAYACNLPATDTLADGYALLAQYLCPDGLLLMTSPGRDKLAVCAGSGLTQWRVLPDWRQPMVLIQDAARSDLRSEMQLMAPLPDVAGGVLTLWHGRKSSLQALQASMAISGAVPALRRAHVWTCADAAHEYIRTLRFFSPEGEIQSLLGADVMFNEQLSIGFPQGRRWIERLRVAAADRDLNVFVKDLRQWLAMLYAQADDDGQLPGVWFSAQPADVRESAEGEPCFQHGEWRYARMVDLRLVICLGLWQLSSDPWLKPLLPEAPVTVVVAWLAEWLEVPIDPEWLQISGHIHQCTGLRAATGWTAPEADAYTQQQADLNLDAYAIAAIRQRLEQLGAPPRLAVCIWDTGSATSAAWQISQDAVAMIDYLQPLECLLASSAEQLQAAMKRSQADWVIILHPGDRLDPATAWILAERVTALADLRVCYLDEDSVRHGQRVEPIFKPDFNLDLLRGYAYTGRGMAFHRLSLLQIGGLDTRQQAAAPAEALLRLVETAGPGAAGHIAEVLYTASTSFDQWLRSPELARHWAGVIERHLQRLGVAHQLLPGPLEGSVQVRYQHVRQPLVSIIIPTRNQLSLLTTLLESLLAKTDYPHFELLIVDNDSDEADACRYLDGLEQLQSAQIRVLRYRHPFNYSAMNNLAAGEARGEYLLLLNNDTAILEPQWLSSMLHHAQRPEVGVVGAKLYFPDGRIQHAGVVMGLDTIAGHPFMGAATDANGYMHRLQFDQNYTAVTAACLLIRREVYAKVGGLDAQNLKVSFNDVDLCLKVTQAGYLTVWTPHARVMHHGSVSQKQLDPDQQAAKLTRFRHEQHTMLMQWMPYMAADPAYNRNLSLQGIGYELDAYRHMAWQPFVEKPMPRVICHPADRTGCGHYRIRQPFLSMQQEGQLTGTVTEVLLNPVMLERFETDAILLQRQHTDAQREAIRHYLKYSKAFKVYELDDYMFNLPLKSVHRSEIPKDMRKQLRQTLAMTDRFVVSTEVLAEQFVDMHEDIRVVMNRLPKSWWEGLHPARRIGARPRVGWGGGSSHTGDLEMIAEVVRALADEVDWVFFGMCPDKLRPYIKEYHAGVPIEQYPAKLASLNLDLALAPLEDNLFNACKSNLRLLEYGACGFPVICTDLVTYRGSLPVTRVKNRFKDWVSAIREHLADLDATAAMGDALRRAVQQDWMLTGRHLEDWRDAWLP